MSQQYKYTIPPQRGGGNLVMKELRVGEIEDTFKRVLAGKAEGAGAFVEAQNASIRASIVTLQGQPWPRGTDGEKRWRDLPPGLKALIASAYEQIHSPEEEESRDFLSSREPVEGQ